MAKRHRANYELSSKTARLNLRPRRKAYFQSIERKLLLGYVRPKHGAGRWVAQREIGRNMQGPIRRLYTVGVADDFAPADGKNVFSYAQATAQVASGRFTSSVGPLTVAQAISVYIEDLRTRKGDRAADDAQSKLNKHIPVTRGNVDPAAVPLCGEDRVEQLTLTQLRKWRDGLVRVDAANPDRERRSKDTANRVLASFKAALNLAFADEANRIPSDKAWRTLKAFKNVGASREDHFTESEALTLIEKAREQTPEFADLLEATFYTGARYGEVAALDVKHFDARLCQIKIPSGKTGWRITTLTDEAALFFMRLASGKSPTDVLLPRPDGSRWGKSHQHRPIKAALKAAGLPLSASIYTLRHTYISRSIERGMPLTLIAENVGTSVRMIEKNYAKSIASVRRTLVERTAPVLRLIEGNKRVA